MTSVPSSRIERPAESEYPPNFGRYVSRVPETDIVSAMEEQIEVLRRLAASIPADKADYRYAPDKWTVRDIFGHLIDGERVFGYRMHCVSRGERASLPSFDENEYVSASHASLPSLAALASELLAARQANVLLARRLDETTSARVGTANNAPVSARALAYILVGHVRHHMAVLDEKYGVR